MTAQLSEGLPSQEQVIDLLVSELDPRVHPKTRDFFEHLKLEVSEKIATFYQSYYRVVLEHAFRVRVAIGHLETHANAWNKETTDLKELYAHAEGFAGKFWPELMQGWDEIDFYLEPLRAHEDNGLALILGNLGRDTASDILDDDKYGELLLRVGIPPYVNVTRSSN